MRTPWAFEHAGFNFQTVWAANSIAPPQKKKKKRHYTQPVWRYLRTYYVQLAWLMAAISSATSDVIVLFVFFFPPRQGYRFWFLGGTSVKTRLLKCENNVFFSCVPCSPIYLFWIRINVFGVHCSVPLSAPLPRVTAMITGYCETTPSAENTVVWTDVGLSTYC